MQIPSSAEDYLETILLLSQKNPAVRSKDIVEEMGFSKPSVSVAMKRLREKGLVEMDEDGFITLTAAGKVAAGRVYDRHTVLCDWLCSIGVAPRVAAADACRMEHVVSNCTVEAIKRMLGKEPNKGDHLC